MSDKVATWKYLYRIHPDRFFAGAEAQRWRLIKSGIVFFCMVDHFYGRIHTKSDHVGTYSMLSAQLGLFRTNLGPKKERA